MRPARLAFTLMSLAGCATHATPEPKVSDEGREHVAGDEAVRDANEDSTTDAGSEGGSEEEAKAEDPEAMPPVDGFFMAKGAPPPRGCKVDGDCMGDTVADPKNPCCADPYSLRPHAKAYRDFVTTWRTDHCEEVECPAPPSPSRPPACAFDVRCEEGLCLDDC